MKTTTTEQRERTMSNPSNIQTASRLALLKDAAYPLASGSRAAGDPRRGSSRAVPATDENDRLRPARISRKYVFVFVGPQNGQSKAGSTTHL
jgi:hypothetical protein